MDKRMLMLGFMGIFSVLAILPSVHAVDYTHTVITNNTGNFSGTRDWLNSLGISGSTDSQLGTMFVDDIGRQIFIIVLTFIVIAVGAIVTKSLYGGLVIGIIPLSLGMFWGWMNPIFSIIIIIGIAFVLMQSLFGSKGGGE
jgi:hypothetical protein